MLPMTADRPPFDTALLSLCAILRWFDHGLLCALAGRDAGGVVALLSSDLVEPVADPAGMYRLSENIRADVLAQLHSEHPSDELTLHTHVFVHFLDRLRETVSGDRRADDEDSCLHHLGELFLLIAARDEWQTLTEHVACVRAASPLQARHLHRLSFYDGFVAVRTHNYERGKAILMMLLDQADLENSLLIQVLNALGNAYWLQTHYDDALVVYQRACTLAYEIGDRFYQAAVLANMGLIYNEIEQFDRALDLATQSLRIFRDLRDSNRAAWTLYDTGMYAMKLGRWQIAQSHFQEAIRLYESLDNQVGLAYVYWGQGLLYHLLGDEAQSKAMYLHAHTISQSQERGLPNLTLDIYFRLGFLYQTQGHWDDALVAYEQAIALAEQIHNPYSPTFIHYRRGNVLKCQGRISEALVAYRQAITGIEALRAATQTEEIKIGLLGTTQQLYEAMVLLCLEQDRSAEAFEYVERARSRAFLDVLAKKSPELYETFDQPVATLAEVQSKLPQGALLLEYFTTGVIPRGESLINQLPPESARLREHLALPPRTLIFAVTRDSFEVHQAALDPNTLRPQPGDPSPGRRLLRERLLNHLHASLVAPVAHLRRGRELLYLIPHGPLHHVPFASLGSAGGDPLIAADGPALAFAPSATVLLRNCLGRPSRSGAAGALALGYNDQEGEPLRYAEAEARHVAALLGGAAIAGPEPKRERLLLAARQARWLHFSGHATYNPRDPLASELRTGLGESLSARAIIGELDLDADLVTLSACTSGVSRVVAGDELLGLQRAFLYAGARSVLCTLWEAADFVALLLMDRFYADLRRGLSPAAALRDAQAALRAMTGRDLAATLDRWRAEDPQFVAALGDLPDIPADQLDERLYADPTWWAPFLLIGKAD
jgi:CHAT domain-containing protein/tetratricopeptide (TPR) repeat protein